MNAPEPRITATRYEISCLPDDHEAAPHLTLRVEYRSRGRLDVLQSWRAYEQAITIGRPDEAAEVITRMDADQRRLTEDEQ